jgi:putative ABC transport system permease protein
MPEPSPASAWSAHLRPRLAQLRLTPAREAEIIEELSQHLEQRFDELRAEGVADADAKRRAIEELLEPDALANAMRSLRQANAPEAIVPGGPRASLVADLWQDLRYAARMLRRQPGFAAAAVLTLALGIGANSAMFALVDATLLRPLPFPNPDRLVTVWEQTTTSQRSTVSPLNLRDWNERSRAFDGLAGFIPNVGGMVMSGADGTSETIPRQWVGANVFDVLGVKAVVGRTFNETDLRQRVNAVVFEESFWRTRFNADPAIVGRTIRLDGAPHVVVGVVPRTALVLGRTSMWALAHNIFSATLPPNVRGIYIASAIGRLKPGVALDTAKTDMTSVADALAREFPNTNRNRGVFVEPMHDAVIGSELRQTSLLFLAVVGFVLLICCANVANLMLTRATARRRELAIRWAIGADRRRVIRQLLTESLLLSVLGTGVGLAIGAAILNVAPSMIPPGLLPPGVTLTFDARVVVFCLITAIAVGLLFGLAPAWQATGSSSPQAIASDSRSVTGRGGRMRGLLVVAEVATAVVLLFGSGLLLRTLLQLQRVDRGYRADSVLTMVLDPLGAAEPVLLRFYEAVAHEVMAVPGVRTVGYASTLPLGRSYEGTSFFEIVGEPLSDDGKRPTADYQIISPTYFSAVDLPVVTGRGFDDRDTRDGAPVCMVNEAFVRDYLHGRSPIGLQLSIQSTATPRAKVVTRQIVGVARQVKERPDETAAFVQIYVPLAQDTTGDIFLVVRPTSGRAEALTAGVRAAIARVDKQGLTSVRDIMTLDDVANEATARHRFRAVLVIAFATLALMLAMVGMFGVLAYSVQQRVRDFGVRRALGATTSDVFRLVAGGAARVIGIGVVIGLALSAALGQLLATLLFGVQPLDWVTFVSVTIVLLLTAAAATAGPAWRATRIDPAIALRTE